MIHVTRKMFYSNLIDKSAGDCRKLFQIVNSLSKERLVEEFSDNRDPSILRKSLVSSFVRKLNS